MAKLSNTNFLSKWLATFADNTTGDISEGDMRDFRQDISDSFMNLTDHASFGSNYETLTDAATVTWNLGSKYFGGAKLYTNRTSFNLSLSNFALGTKRRLWILLDASGADCVITFTGGGGYLFVDNNKRYPVTTVTLRGASYTAHLLEFERIDDGTGSPQLVTRFTYLNRDKDAQNINIVKGSHGLAVGDIVVKTGSNYSKLSALTQVPIGIVDFLSEGSYAANNFRIAIGGMVYGLSGLTANTMYYVQSTGVLGTTVTNLPFLWAISTTSGYIYKQASLIDEDNMASNSDKLAPTQQSVKAYVDSLTTISPAAGRSQYPFSWMDTTGATANQDWNLFTTEEDLIINVTAQIIGLKTDGAQGYYAEKSATFRKDGSATAVQVGTTTTQVEHKDDGETTSIAMNSTDVRISVNTGDADTYRWTVFATITRTKL